MFVFKLRPTEKTVNWLKQHKIDSRALEIALTLIFGEIYPKKKIKKKQLTIQVDMGSDGSTYYFGTDKILLCDKPYADNNSLKYKKIAIFRHLLHEFRHWMQSQVLGIKASQLNYTEEDYVKNNKKYKHNKYEKDARKFEDKFVVKFMKYYSSFKTSGQ
jgi:hypothetical protein